MLMSDETKPVPLTKAQSKLLDASAHIFGEMATKKDAAYLPRELVQVTLPHTNPGNIPAWQRTNGTLSVAIQAGWDVTKKESYGYPYGIIPRLLLFWITTEAIRTNCRRLELGSSLSGFMADVGLSADTGGGKRGDARRLRDQMQRLFHASISFVNVLEQDGRRGVERINMHVATRSELWWSRKDPDQAALWGSWIELGEDFFKAITAYPVPADVRALKALKRSPLALDLYAWLTYEAFRAHKIGKPRYENWEQIHGHIGGEYTHLHHFRAKAKAALRKIQIVYPGLKLGKRMGGIEVLPESYPAIQPRTLTIDGTCTRL
jgi:hypothetical protein